jgi:hypothetical protein
MGDTKGYCDFYTAEDYKTQNDLMDIIESLPITRAFKKSFYETIEKYGDAKYDEAREDAREDCEAGENL